MGCWCVRMGQCRPSEITCNDTDVTLGWDNVDPLRLHVMNTDGTLVWYNVDPLRLHVMNTDVTLVVTLVVTHSTHSLSQLPVMSSTRCHLGTLPRTTCIL